MPTSTAKKVVLKVEPLHAHVIHDLESCVGCFAIGPSHSYAAFRETFSRMKMTDIFLTQRSGGRLPAPDENSLDYVRLLLRAASLHMLRPSSFEHQLGGLFLTFTLWKLQMTNPAAALMLSEEDWTAFETLAQTLRDRCHAE